MDRYEEESMLSISKLQLATTNLKILLQTSSGMEASLNSMDKRLSLLDETISETSRTVAPLQSLSMAKKALETRINRAVSPALKLQESFKLADSLQKKLLDLSSKLPTKRNPEKRLKHLLKYVNCVDRLNTAMEPITLECEPVFHKLQEAVEFLSRTKATDQHSNHRLRETLVTLKAVYETEIDSMKYEGLLDEALMNLQDECENILQQMMHKNVTDDKVEDGGGAADLGSELEVEVLRRISETLARNDCLDICIDIFVKVRYKRAAKALMRLNPDYLKTFAPEVIDEMEWENLESAISLWIQHLELAIRRVLSSEKKLSKQVLSGVMDGLIWAECFVKIADKIMAVFFRFGEGVARSSKEPQKLFKLLDMFHSMEKLKTEFSEIFEGEAGEDICARFRELEKLLVHASTKVFWEFGLQIEGNQDGVPPPKDGSVPKVVRYAVNYLKYLATENYKASMAKVLQIEQIWKAGLLSKPESEEDILKDSISNVMEALQRNVEAKKSRYRDKVLPHIFTMNTYWYIYIRTKNSELANLLGSQWFKNKYKNVAEESAYMYQKQAWGPLVKWLEREDLQDMEKEDVEVVVRGKLETFLKGIDENLQRHGNRYTIPDDDLRKQMKESVVKFVVSGYAGFLHSCSSVLQVKSYLAPDSIRGLLEQAFDGHGGDFQVLNEKPNERRRDMRNRERERVNSTSKSLHGYEDFRRINIDDG